VSKKYLVEITATAKADIRGIREHIAADNPKAANRWAANVERLVNGLEDRPFSYEVIPEAADLGMPYRHKLFGNYRIIYRVEGDRVLVLRVFHGAQLLKPEMLP
jgi:toxin ParE1/3/4